MLQPPTGATASNRRYSLQPALLLTNESSWPHATAPATASAAVPVLLQSSRGQAGHHPPLLAACHDYTPAPVGGHSLQQAHMNQVMPPTLLQPFVIIATIIIMPTTVGILATSVHHHQLMIIVIVMNRRSWFLEFRVQGQQLLQIQAERATSQVS